MSYSEKSIRQLKAETMLWSFAAILTKLQLKESWSISDELYTQLQRCAKTLVARRAK